ncbi:DUF808 domain-containing protein [Pokkaliibacter sp. CJK22405]|uniref:DUF808 domain-containing protein n=1 Tax=Pokkaliibacter sp. CJK22405 TaxID=3384615 RepID=UPI0039849546
MASSLLALIDDIASLMDDVSLMTKTAAKKTTGVLGDDLALNAQQVTGVSAERELPIVWSVAKGSLLNKCILVPAALAISAFIPWAITPLLMLGGAFLSFEGAEKIAHLFHKKDTSEEKRTTPLTAEEEKKKISGAVRTDFILSAEIIALTLGIVSEAPILQQLMVLAIIAVVITLGVYGLVAGIVKLDDAGLWMTRQSGAVVQRIGHWVLAACPWLMKGLSIVGTAAMFVVGGGILTHGFHFLSEWAHHLQSAFTQNNESLAWLSAAIPTLIDVGVGLVAGFAILLVVNGISKLRGD